MSPESCTQFLSLQPLPSLLCCSCTSLSRVVVLSWEGVRESLGGGWQPEGIALWQFEVLECISPTSWTAGWSLAFSGSSTGAGWWEASIAWWAAVFFYWEIKMRGCSSSLCNICKRSAVGGYIIDSHMACWNPDTLLGPIFRSRLRKKTLEMRDFDLSMGVDRSRVVSRGQQPGVHFFGSLREKKRFCVFGNNI